MLSIFSIIGSLYIIWIAYKINNSNPEISSSEDKQELTFTDGLLMQLMNPKGITVALPIAAVQFPALHITGLSIVIWCALLAIISFGAPLAYSVLGIYLGEKIKNPIYFKMLNKVMASFLLIVAIKMLVAEFL